jgi:predicted dehydrogenase
MLTAGIIGLGVGEAHIEGYENHPGSRVGAVCDFNQARLEEVGRKHPGIGLTSRADDIIDDPSIDIVSIASYDCDHFPQVMRAIEKGKHVFVEKPLCLYEREAREIRGALANKPDLKISSNLILRKSPRFMSLKKWIDAGRFGSLYHIEGDYNYGRLNKITEGWRGDIDFYSVVHGGGIHLLDLFLWLTGDRVEEAAAAGNGISSRGSKFRYNDMVVSILRFASGMTGKLAVNYGCVHPHFHPLTVYGTKATFINGRENASLYESRDPEKPPQAVRSAYPGVRKGALIHGFVESILRGTEPEVGKEDIFRAMSVCFAIEEAAASSSFVRVKYI